ncbi:MAG: triple tyrosine motif-containing protein [Cyclobacteriaceae bacterium]
MISCVDNKRLWITTSGGLLSFDKTTHGFNRFTANDGLLENEMNGVISSFQNGKIIYAVGNHFTVFRSDELLKPTTKPKVTITEVFSQNQLIQWLPNKKNNKEITLDHTYNNFTFHWALLNYRNPLQNQYYCKLEGIDKDWKYVGNVGQAEYASLPSGTYTFHVRGTTSDGIKNELDDFLIIIIEPPFWKTAWFIIGCILLASTLIYLIYRYRLNQILLQERMRSKISTDLHDDIGSTLSSISILGDLVLQKTSDDSASTMVKEIRDNAQVLMEKMDDIVWGINPENDSLEKLLLRIKRFASQLFEAKNIEYSIDVQEHLQQIKLPMDHRQHIYLILKEAINNLVKHAQCNKAAIKVCVDNNFLVVLVSDNGKGYDIDSNHNGNGIRSIKKRSESMRAELTLRSKASEGSTMELKVKIK